MSKHKIRKNKTCLNCGSFVEKSHCPKCGQENSESRQSFYHLFTHFVSDYLHYDSSFWKSIKCLFLYPGKLSLEYMKGKRKSYVNPFSLYIFISFLAFLIPFLLPDPHNTNAEETADKKRTVVNIDKDTTVLNNNQLLSVQLDSIYRNSSPEKQLISTDNIIYKTALNVADNMDDEHRKEKAMDFFVSNIPKALFIYMPIFAFMLWLFHNKKRFYYFDSGIFTLHFFSIALFCFTIGSILVCIANWLDWGWLTVLTWIFSIFYITFYFFRGSRIFYNEKRWASNIKSSIQVIINFILILLILIIYGLFTVVKVYG